MLTLSLIFLFFFFQDTACAQAPKGVGAHPSEGLMVPQRPLSSAACQSSGDHKCAHVFQAGLAQGSGYA